MKDYPTNKENIITTFNYSRLIAQDANAPKQRMKLYRGKVGIEIKPQGPKTSMRLVLRPSRGRGNR